MNDFLETELKILLNDRIEFLRESLESNQVSKPEEFKFIQGQIASTRFALGLIDDAKAIVKRKFS
jgi:hypothetical protein